MAGHDLVVLGDCNPDLVVTGDVVPAFEQVEKIVDQAVLTIGGSGAITAAGAARLGLRTALVGVVGDDQFGRLQLDALRTRSVDVRSVVVDPDALTGLTIVLSKGDDRAILTFLGTIGALRSDLIDRDLLLASRHVHVSSYFLQHRLRPDLPAIFQSLRAGGVTTSLDTNWDPSGEWDDGLRALLPHVDCFFPNATEAMRITGESSVEAAAETLAREVSMAVVKLGPAGALARSGSTEVRQPALPVEVVDTCGAGDSFASGFIAARLAGWPLDPSLAIACACGSLSTRAIGGVASQPTLAEACAAAGIEK
jgi:sugar/nucleoside kinase (ribokinase family)